MMEAVLNWLEGIGLWGLWIAMSLEGSSIPFPGVVVALAYGHLLPFSFGRAMGVASVMSAIYTITSLLPYWIGLKVGNKLEARSTKGMKQATEFFSRYGAWSVALSRPFGIGNYISYVAGIGKMKSIPYLLYTFIGILPWSFGMLLIGHHLRGSYEAFLRTYQSNSPLLYGALVIILILGILLVRRKHSWKKPDYH